MYKLFPKKPEFKRFRLCIIAPSGGTPLPDLQSLNQEVLHILISFWSSEKVLQMKIIQEFKTHHSKSHVYIRFSLTVYKSMKEIFCLFLLKYQK